MTTEPVRAGADWLGLREPADAAARATDLVEVLRSRLGRDGVLQVHDLGCGTGSMARWLAARLPGPQHWVLSDRDAALLPLAAAGAPRTAADGAPVSVETVQRDITRLDPDELSGASLVTASALLDMMTGQELDRFVATCVGSRCPTLITLSVTGHVELSPGDPSDGLFGAAFNDHQRRDSLAGRRLGPDAFATAVAGFTTAGLEVLVRPSPWVLGSGAGALSAAWLDGWVGAACEQRPELEELRTDYLGRRLAELADGHLEVTVHHEDLLALPA
ncbi:class I SAM-dependent methyltransferase [Nocardioides sp.]|uniref:class I SAM-dependent methyltransferase n=1 Tax=Nocardioides sp. TaxID=35761 RepID=UPI002D7FC100|nr:class I SAM-dependent methyltransferase [Nocardioides sp.]HET8960221.1 class I SAM-dependent methyltransferase [Nocardioides sp.]